MRLFIGLVFLYSFALGELNAQTSVNDFLLIRVNELRDSLKLPRLKGDATLDKAATNHAVYIASKRKLTHEQNVPDMHSVADRIFHFGGNRTYCGENVAMLGDLKLTDNREIANQLFEAWRNSPGHYANMIHPNYSRMGLGIKRGTNGIYAAQVFGSEEIKLPKQFNGLHPNWGIKPNPEVCRALNESYETMTFANNIQIQGHEVYFFFHDMPFFNAVISDKKDGLAIDVVLRDQLPCSRENQFHISPIFDGQMQKPVYRDELLKNNLSGNPYKILVKIGEIPESMRKLDWAVNVIVIKNNFNCDYCVPSIINSGLFPLLPIVPFWEKIENSNRTEIHKILWINDTINFSFHFGRGNEQFDNYDLAEMNRLLFMLPFVKQVRVDCYASVEGSESINKNLLEKRRESLYDFLVLKKKLNAHLIEWNLDENWSMMQTQIIQNNLLELNGKSRPEIRNWLRENPSKLYDSLLYEQRASRIQAIVDTTVEIHDFETLAQFAKYDTSFSKLDYLWSEVLELCLYNANMKLNKADINSILSDRRLITNFLAVLPSNYSVFTETDSMLIEKHLTLLNKKNLKQIFNYANFLTHYWYRKFSSSYSLLGIAKTISPEELFQWIEPLAKFPEITTEQLDNLKFNIYLAGVLYYTAYNDWKLKDKYFDAIVNIVVERNFTVNRAERLALFFNYFHKFERTVKLLHPYFERNELSENGIFLLAETSTLTREKLDENQYQNYMATAKKTNLKRYCQWLNDYFQIQRDEYIKRDFCSSCGKIVKW